MLEMQIESRLHERQGKAITNFSRTLPPLQSDMAQALLKDPYNFDFLTLSSDAHERDVERGLLEHIRRFFTGTGSGVRVCRQSVPVGGGRTGWRCCINPDHALKRMVLNYATTPDRIITWTCSSTISNCAALS